MILKVKDSTSGKIKLKRVLYTVFIILLIYFLGFHLFLIPTAPNYKTVTIFRCIALTTALLQYRNDNGFYPTGNTKEIILKLTLKHINSKGSLSTYLEPDMPRKNFYGAYIYSPMLDNNNFLDAWGRPIQLVVSVNQITIKSLGKNGRDDNGEKDDIVYINGRLIENNFLGKDNQ